jgi:RNA polymerase sigma factor (sigma-70 family)
VPVVTALPPFQRFLDAERDVVWRCLVAMVGHTDADDVFQETFMAALRAYPDLRSDRTHNLRAWVLTIAHRKALDHLGARARRAVPVEHLPEVPVTDPPGRDEELWDRVRALPPKMRAAVTLRYAGDLTHAEIATAMGCSEEAARRSAHEGLKRLREVEHA